MKIIPEHNILIFEPIKIGDRKILTGINIRPIPVIITNIKDYGHVFLIYRPDFIEYHYQTDIPHHPNFFGTTFNKDLFK